MAKATKKPSAPSNVRKVLSKLKKRELELGEFCLDKIYKNLNEGGYADATALAPSILPAILNEIGYSENPNDIEDFLLNLDGIEKSIAESVYTQLNFLKKNVKGAKHKDICDTLVYSIGKVLETKDKEKYKRLYG